MLFLLSNLHLEHPQYWIMQSNHLLLVQRQETEPWTFLPPLALWYRHGRLNPVTRTMINLPLLAQSRAVPVDFLRWFPWCPLVYLLPSDQPLLLVSHHLSLLLMLEKTEGMPLLLFFLLYFLYRETIRHCGVIETGAFHYCSSHIREKDKWNVWCLVLELSSISYLLCIYSD